MKTLSDLAVVLVLVAIIAATLFDNHNGKYLQQAFQEMNLYPSTGE